MGRISLSIHAADNRHRDAFVLLGRGISMERRQSGGDLIGHVS